MTKLVLRLLVLLLAGSFNQKLSAQDEDIDVFYRTYKDVVIKAAKTGTKSLTIRLHTRFSENFSGDRTKLKIKYLNDSVFVRKYRWRKSTFIIRGDEFYAYDKDTMLYSGYVAFSSIDSAGYLVNWGIAFEGMKDSSALSYSRLKFDSLERLVDYYYTHDTTCTHMVSEYSGDSVCITNLWSCQGDSMVLLYSNYCFREYNADSTFYIQILKYTNQNDKRYRRWEISTERGYITYDDQRRIVNMRIEELNKSEISDDWPYSHTMRVIYK